MGLGRTARFYRKNKASRDKKKAYDTEYHKTPKRRKYRALLNKEARKRGIYGKRKGMGKDLHHKKDGGLVLTNSSKNRAMDRPKKSKVSRLLKKK